MGSFLPEQKGNHKRQEYEIKQSLLEAIVLEDKTINSKKSYQPIAMTNFSKPVIIKLTEETKDPELKIN